MLIPWKFADRPLKARRELSDGRRVCLDGEEAEAMELGLGVRYERHDRVKQRASERSERASYEAARMERAGEQEKARVQDQEQETSRGRCGTRGHKQASYAYPR